jgi:hypothetical protein
VCRACEPSFPDRLSLDRRLVDLMLYILRLDQAGHGQDRLPKLTRHQTDPINRVLAAHVQHTLGRPLRLAAWVL